MVRFLLMCALPLMATPLHEAVYQLDHSKTFQLLKEGADVDALDAHGDTVMHIAAHYGRVSMVELLLQHHPNLYQENAQGYTPLGVAIARNHVKSIYAILSVQRQQEYRLDLLPLHQGVVDNDIRRVLQLLQDGFDVNAPNLKGMTALHVASKLGNATMVNLLIDNGAHIDAVDDEGRDVLYYARYSNESMVKAIIIRERKRQERGKK